MEPKFTICIGNLSHLQHLDLSLNYLSGTSTTAICSLTSLTYLELSDNKCDLSLPSCLGKLSLQILGLRSSQLNDNIPESLGTLSSLSSLDVSYNQLNGIIPKSLGNLSSLSSLDISSNQLNGNISESLGNLSSLYFLDISHNLVSGRLPSSFAKLSSLTIFYAEDKPSSMNDLRLPLNNNQTISETFFQNLTKLERLSLSKCVLNISTTWIPSFQLRELVSCKMNGQIPLWISTQFILEGLTLADNNLSGEIPSWLWETFSSLYRINLTANHLQGRLFANSSMWMHLKSLDVSKNLLSGYLPSLWSPLTTLLQLNDNMFRGNIPPSLGTSSHLQLLNLGNNHLNGIIPPSLANCSSLEVLNLGNNSLRGQIPCEFGRLCWLQSLVVRNNKLNGLFPPSITNCTVLQFLDIGDNLFKGQIPKSIGNFSLLKVLVMKGNNFTGSIPPEIGQLAELQILHLSSNGLSGFIPGNISFLQAMTIVNEDGFVLFERFVTDGIFFGRFSYSYSEGLHMIAKGI